jgi:hypothetical protein
MSVGSDGTIYLVSNIGIAAYSSTGIQQWTLDDDLLWNVVIGGDGTLYGVSSSAGAIQAIH